MLQEKTETQQRQRKTPGLGSQRDLESQQREVSVVCRVCRTDPRAAVIALGEGPFRPQVRSRCLVQLHLLSITRKPFPLRLIPTISQGRAWLVEVRELPPGAPGQCQSRGVPRLLATPHCPWQDALSPAFPSPTTPAACSPTVQAHSPGPEARPTVQAHFERSLLRTGSFLSLSLNSSSELPSQASLERLPEHLRHVSYAFPTPGFFPVDGLPDCRGPGPSHHPTLFRKPSLAPSSSQTHTNFSHTILNNPIQFLFYFSVSSVQLLSPV